MSHFVSQGGDFDDLNAQLGQRRSTIEQDDGEGEEPHSTASGVQAGYGVLADRRNDARGKSSTNLTRTNSFAITDRPDRDAARRPNHRFFRRRNHSQDYNEADLVNGKQTPRKLGTWDGVFMPVSLNILGIILFLRFGFIIGQAGLLGSLVLLSVSYLIDALTAMSVSAISTNGQVRGGGAYYLISRSLGPEFGGSIGLVFFLGQALNASMNVLGFVESLTDAFGVSRQGFLPEGPWWNFSYGSVCLLLSTLVCLVGSSFFKRATLALAIVLAFAIASIPISSVVMQPFGNPGRGAFYTGWRLETLKENMLPHFTSGAAGSGTGAEKENWQTVFGVLFPAVTGLLAGVSMSGDLRKPSKSIPKGTNWSLAFTYAIYVICFVIFAGTIARPSFYLDVGIVSDVALSPQLITFGVLASTAFSALMGVMACGKILQAIARDDLLPILSTFAQGTEVNDTPIYAVAITWTLCQAVLFVDSVNVIAQLVTMTSLLTFGTLSFATLALKAGGAPSFRPSFRYWNVWTAGAGTIASFGAMFFTEPYAASGCIVLAIFLFSAIHIFSPPKPWGDVSQNLNYHIVRKYLLRLDERKSRITHWRPQILLLSNNARADWNLIIFCNSLKKGALYVLGHVIKGEFGECLDELRQQNHAWLKLVDISGIKSFVNIIIAPDEREGARSLILSCGLGGMRPNIVCMAFPKDLPRAPPPAKAKKVLSHAGKDDSAFTIVADTQTAECGRDQQTPQRDDVPALPTDSSRSESPILPQTYVGIMEDSLALQKALAIAYGFESMSLSGPSTIGRRDKDQEDIRYIDLWPVQIQSPNADKSHAWDTYTMVLQLGTILSMTGSWKSHKLRVSVFVEFKGDMEAEKRRVQMLLDNLRVPAKLRVFCLSTSGSQNYESIVQGMGSANANVESSLRGDPWWESLKAIRARAQELKGTSTAAKSSSTISSETKDVDGTVQDKRERRLFGVSLPKEHQDYFQRNMRIGLAHPRVGRRAARQVRSESESEMSASESEDELSSEEDSTDELAHLDLSDVRVLDSRYGARSRRHASRGSGTWRRLASSRSRRSSTSHLEEGGSVTGSYGSMSSTPRASDMRKARDHLANLGSEGTVRAKGRHWTQAKQVFSKQPTDSSAADEHEDGPAQAPTSTGEQTRTPEVSASGHHSPMITFNDLPNKAQYLILNELIRIHSAPSTSVVLTALPAPEPGTAKDPHRSLRYLHLIDSLLGGGPPILGVHAKQLTMTSAL